MVKAVTPSLPEPGVWIGMASANVLEPLRWKRAKTHRCSRHRHMPHQEAGYTSAAVALDPQHAEHRCNRVGSIYVHTWHIALFRCTAPARPQSTGKRTCHGHGWIDAIDREQTSGPVDSSRASPTICCGAALGVPLEMSGQAPRR